MRSITLCIVAAGSMSFCGGASAQLAVESTAPVRNANNVARSATVSVTFNQAVDQTTFTYANFKVFGKVSGPVGPGAGVGGTLSFSGDGRTVTMTPSQPFAAGEVVLVMMSGNLMSQSGEALRAAGHAVMFTIGVAESRARFREIDRFSNRDETGEQTRIYGGLACDLNRDGFCDLTTVNEVSSDLRVFLNRADGSGLFEPMLTPYTPIPFESSPNEVGDFDGDGLVDMVISSNLENRVAHARGLGNGRFATPVLINSGSFPRGFGVLDADGDGDMDFAVACASANVVQLYRNNGNGTFAAPLSTVVAGRPYGMTAAEMNNDGILDLVVGCEQSQNAVVLRGVGNGTFVNAGARSLGGANWVVACGDLNNDGNIDVSAANSGSSNGSILMGNGNGTLQAAAVMATGGHTVSTDLTDLDGDGDLDWVLSSFGAGLWYVYLNDGAGHFGPLEEVVAPANPSCAVPMDVDNDGDVDLALTDEIADVVVLLENFCPADWNDADGVDSQDFFDFLEDFFSGDADFNGEDGTDSQDYFDFLGSFFDGC